MNNIFRFFVVLTAAALFSQASVYLYLHKNEVRELAFVADDKYKTVRLSEKNRKSGFESELISYKNCSFDSDLQPTRQTVIFDEVAWMGTEKSSGHEWFKLKKLSADEVNLSGWQIINKNERLKVIFPQGSLFTDTFYLLERNTDSSLPQEKANLLYSGALKNNDEGLRLFDNNCVLMDEVLADPNWPAGDNQLKLTMKRKANLSWYGGQLKIKPPEPVKTAEPVKIEPVAVPPTAAMTPVVPTKEKIENIDEPAPALVPQVIETAPQPAENPPSVNILIKRIQAGSEISANDEFVELYNPNSRAVNLNNWSLKKKTKSGNEYNLVSKSKFQGLIAAQAVFLIAHKEYQGQADLLYSNNSNPLAYSGNSIMLYDSEDRLVEKVDLETAKGEIWTR